MMRQSSSDLFDCIEVHSSLPERSAAHIFRQLTSTLLGLASIGIAHCDLKDENIVVDSALRVKLVDFGSAYLFDPAAPYEARHDSAFAGSATYAPPEVLRDQKDYPLLKGEVWAMGVLLSILLTGHSPFASRECQRMGRRLRKKRRTWSDETEEVLAGCLTVEVGERWTFEQIRDSRWLKGEGP